MNINAPVPRAHRTGLFATDFTESLFATMKHFSVYDAFPIRRDFCIGRAVTVELALEQANQAVRYCSIAYVLFEENGQIWRVLSSDEHRRQAIANAG